MRKFIALVCLLTLLVVPVAAKPKFAPNLPIEASDEIEIEIGKTNGKSNGKSVSLGVAPMIHNGRTYMPIRSLSGLLGAKVDYHPKKNGDEIVLEFPSFTVLLKLNSTWLTIKQGSTEQRHDMKLPVVANRGTAFVPLVPLAQAIGYSVEYNPSGKVKISKNPSEGPVTPAPTAVSFVRPSDQTLKFTLTPESPKVIIGKGKDILANPGAYAEGQVLVVYRGTVTSGGHDIDINTLTQNGVALTISVTLTNPNTQQINYPYDVVVLTRTIQVTTWSIPQLGRTGSVTLPPTASVNVNGLGQAALKQRLNPKNYTVVVGKAKDLLQNLGQVQPETQVMVVYRGEFGNTGYGIRVETLSIGNQVAHIGVSLQNPLSDHSYAEVVSYPYDVIVLPTGAIFDTWVLTAGNGQLGFGTVTLLKDWSVVTYALNLSKVDPTVRGLHVGYGKDLLLSPGDEANSLFAVVKRGESPTLGYGIAVTSIELVEKDVVRINAQSITPTADLVGQAITYPYQVVKLNPNLADMSFQFYLDGVKVLPQTTN